MQRAPLGLAIGTLLLAAVLNAPRPGGRVPAFVPGDPVPIEARVDGTVNLLVGEADEVLANGPPVATIDEAPVTSPVTGTLERWRVRTGDLVALGQRLADVAPPPSHEVVVCAPEAIAGELDGATAEVFPADGSSPRHGVVEGVAPRVTAPDARCGPMLPWTSVRQVSVRHSGPPLPPGARAQVSFSGAGGTR